MPRKRFTARERRCPKCNQVKLLSNFYNKYGMCRACRAIKTITTAEHEAAYQRAYYRQITRPKREAARQFNRQTAVNE